jgi:hypothetical protein
MSFNKQTNCIVTAYYNIRSKTSKEQYLEWINNFMNTVIADVKLYTSSDMVEYFNSFNKSNVTIIVNEFLDLYYYKYYDIFKKQWELDNIKDRRSPELFILWYNKLRFVEDASIKYGDKYNNYIWCDIGCFREKEYLERRSNFCLNEFKLEKPILLKLREPNEKDTIMYNDNIYGFMDQVDCFIGGTILAIPKTKIEDVIKLQDTVFNKLIVSDRFFGCDQRCYAYMWAENKEMFDLITPPYNYTPDIWFYLLDLYSIKGKNI